jgi:hypothetical protein
MRRTLITLGLLGANSLTIYRRAGLVGLGFCLGSQAQNSNSGKFRRILLTNVLRVMVKEAFNASIL